MSLSPVINGSETGVTTRKRLSAKDLQIDLNDELDIDLTTDRSSQETDEIFLTTEDSSPAIGETFQTTGESTPPEEELFLTTGKTSLAIQETFQTTGETSAATEGLSLTTGETLPVIGKTFQATEETSPATGELLLTSGETSPSVGETVPPTEGTESTSEKAADVKSASCNTRIVNSTTENPASDSVLVTAAETDRDSPRAGDQEPTNAPGIEAEPLDQQLQPDELALLAKLEEANRWLEADRRSLQSISPQSQRKVSSDPPPTGEAPALGHSRHGSLSSQMSSLSASSSSSNPPMEEVPDDLWSTWKSLVDDWDNKSKRKSFNLKELVRRGIPTHFRGTAWPMLCNAHVSQDKVKYSEYMRMSSPCEKLIRRDIARTYPEHHFFQDKNGSGQEMLFNVMKAYSLHDREVGYCQGTGFIVGLLLMQMPEEDAFAVFVKIMQCLRLRELYKPNMAEIGLCMFQLEAMIQEHLPELHSHFQVHGLCVSMFAAPWFLTLLTASLPLSLACRVFDIFLLEGLEIIFRMGFAILQMFSTELQTVDMEGMIKILQKDLPIRLENETEQLFSTAFQVKYNPRKMKNARGVDFLNRILDKMQSVVNEEYLNDFEFGLEKDYNALKMKEDEEQTEIRRLRTENRLLRQRIDNLETETATLADRLIQDQVKYAQQSEEIYTLRRAVSYTRRQSIEVSGSSTKLDDLDRDGLTSGFDEDVNGSTVEQLQKTVADMVNEEIKAKAVIQDLRTKIQELEKANQQASSEPSIDVQNLQDQLIASKMREAETNLSTRELEQKVNELEKYWQKHLESVNTPDVKWKLGRSKHQEVSDELMSAKIREASMTAEVTELKQKFMELETKNHIHERQIKRLEGENEKLKDSNLEHEAKEKELESQVNELARQLADMEAKKKEEEIMSRIKEAEHSQLLAEMRQRIAELEIQNQELQTSAQLHERGVGGDRQDLENKIVDLQEELQMLQFKMSQKVMASSLMANSFGMDSDSDVDFDDIDSSRLRLTDSMGPQLANEVFGTSTPKNGNFRDIAAFINVSEDKELSGLDQDSESQLGKPPRRLESVSLDYDKTPTNDSSNNHLFASIIDASVGKACSSDLNGQYSTGDDSGQLLSMPSAGEILSTPNGCDIVGDAKVCAQEEPSAQS